MSDTLKPAFGLIGNALKSTAADHIVAVADDLYDERSGLYQSEINRVALQGGGSGESNHFFMSTDQYATLIKDGKIDEITLVISDKTITKDEKGRKIAVKIKGVS